ncbi:hypothetical protein PCASD_25887 [Puccinia coronata f. sp. avenae]|uniref:Uncharacterized protein n=1 Tax=Puccinia coronata f. sp. avenae TaxID=200324 RepID=A0A2N5RU92_9BASI|nr:hypothetical protein PCASD_25887 [Puccinia coronata f. sp. avenae]
MDGPEAANGTGDDVATGEPEAVSGDTKLSTATTTRPRKRTRTLRWQTRKWKKARMLLNRHSWAKGIAPEMEDEAEQMDCAVTPNPQRLKVLLRRRRLRPDVVRRCKSLFPVLNNSIVGSGFVSLISSLWDFL